MKTVLRAVAIPDRFWKGLHEIRGLETVFRAVAVMLILLRASTLLMEAGDETMGWLPAVAALLLLPTLAIWVMVGGKAALPKAWLRRVVELCFLNVLCWIGFLSTLQDRAINHPAEQERMLLFFGLTTLITIWLLVRARAWPSWRDIGGITTAAALVAFIVGVGMWGYDWRTRTIITQVEKRWAEIGLPMGELEKTLTPIYENTGSLFLRHALRAQVNSHFYKDGTRLAQREPATERSDAIEERIARALKLLEVKLPPSDDLALATASVAAMGPEVTTLDADYRCLLAADSPSWYSDPHDGYELDVPNFLGIRKFAQIVAADAVERFSRGDQEGAERALAAGLHLREGLWENPTLVSLMISVAVDSLLSVKQVWLTAPDDGLSSIARDAARLRAEFLRRLQIEGWVSLGYARANTADAYRSVFDGRIFRRGLPEFVRQRRWGRIFATAALADAEHAAIQKSPVTLTLPDLGASLHTAVSEKRPTELNFDCSRAVMRIHAMLLLREQVGLIRDARVCFAAGRPVESRDSVVLPGLRWERKLDTGKGTVSLRLAGAPEWILKDDPIQADFWVLPLDGSVAWQFHLPARDRPPYARR